MRITSKGQVTVPMAIREQLGLMTNAEVECSVGRGGVGITKAATDRAPSRRRAIVERMRRPGTGKMTTEQIMKLLRG